jgi:hypothetical protein
VKIGQQAAECYVYRGDVANNAIKLAGSEIGLFAERREHKHVVGSFKNMSDVQLLEALRKETEELLALERKTIAGEPNVCLQR